MTESKNNYTIVSYATINTPYVKVMQEHIEASARKYSDVLKFDFQLCNNRGSWYANTAHKPKFIMEMFEKHGTDIVFLDCDATIERYPDVFDIIPEDCDVACHFLDWAQWYQYETNYRELLSGTIYLRNNDHVKNLCMDWYIKAQKKDMWEQKVLEQIITNHNVKLYPLPLEYCYIKTLPDGREPHIKVEPVILHHQASRKYKGLLK